MNGCVAAGLLGSAPGCYDPDGGYTLVDELAEADSNALGDADESSDVSGASLTNDSSGTTESTGSSDGSDSGETTDEAAMANDDVTDEGPLLDMHTPPEPKEQIPPPDEDGCHAIYAQDALPTFELEISDSVWDKLVYYWNHGKALDAKDKDTKLDLPLEEFRYGDIVIHDATIRLRGNPEFWEPLPDDKLQFQIDFDQNDEDGHFLGLKKLALDAATANRHMLRDRLALSILRDVGIIAPCANHAKVFINGEYYGIFTNLEKLDEVFLARVFDDPTGDLWERAGWKLKTNKDIASDDRLDDLKDADSPEELETYLDLEQALRVFAADAVIPNSDGPWAGGLNFYLYDDPLGGKFVMLPWDLDNTFERFAGTKDYPSNPDPVVWEKKKTHGRPWYELALEEPKWFDYYIQQVEEVFAEGYQLEVLHERIDTWTDQIEEAVLEDTNKPYSNKRYYKELEILRDFVDDRHDFMVEWLECWQDGGKPNSKGYCKTP